MYGDGSGELVVVVLRCELDDWLVGVCGGVDSAESLRLCSRLLLILDGCELLELLMRSPGRVYTRTQIIEHVWGYDFDPQTNLVDVYIRRVRKKVDGEHESALIETVRGVGYRFKD